MSDEDLAALVVENGSGMLIRAGCTGEDTSRAVFPSIVGIHYIYCDSFLEIIIVIYYKKFRNS
jgi:hypothetical protein